MSKRKKKDNINTSGGTHVDGNINIDGHGTFIGRDQKSSSDRKLKLEVIVPVIVATITVVGTIIVAIINYSTQTDKARLQIHLTQTSQVIVPIASFTPIPPITETVTSSPTP